MLPLLQFFYRSNVSLQLPLEAVCCVSRACFILLGLPRSHHFAIVVPVLLVIADELKYWIMPCNMQCGRYCYLSSSILSDKYFHDPYGFDCGRNTTTSWHSFRFSLILIWVFWYSIRFINVRSRSNYVNLDSGIGEIFPCGIRNPTKDWNPESKLHWKRMESSTWNLESTTWKSRIQDCFGSQCWAPVANSCHCYFLLTRLHIVFIT